MLPLKKPEYAVPAHSNDGVSRDPSSARPTEPSTSPIEKDEPPKSSPVTEPGNCQEDNKQSAPEEVVQPASRDLLKTQGKGRPRKNAENGNQQKNSEQAPAVEAAVESGLPDQPIEASDSGLGGEVSQPGPVTERVQDSAQPSEEAAQLDVKQTKAGLDDAPSLSSQTEPVKKKGRGRPRKNPTTTNTTPAESTDTAPAKCIDTTPAECIDTTPAECIDTTPAESLKAAAPTESVQANTPTESVQATAPTESVQAISEQPEPPKKRGRGRPPRKTPTVTHPKSPKSPPESARESDTAEVKSPSDVSEPLEKKAKLQDVGGAEQVDNSVAANVSFESPRKNDKNPASVLSSTPPEEAKGPAADENPVADICESEPPQKKAKEEEEGADLSKDSAPCGVPSDSPQKKARGRPRKNVASTETAQPFEANDEEPAMECNTTHTEEPKQKRGRGRPPGPAKRGRGRPRKNPTGTFHITLIMIFNSSAPTPHTHTHTHC